MVEAAHQLTKALQNNVPVSGKQAEALKQVSDVFENIAADKSKLAHENDEINNGINTYSKGGGTISKGGNTITKGGKYTTTNANYTPAGCCVSNGCGSPNSDQQPLPRTNSSVHHPRRRISIAQRLPSAKYESTKTNPNEYYPRSNYDMFGNYIQ